MIKRALALTNFAKLQIPFKEGLWLLASYHCHAERSACTEQWFHWAKPKCRSEASQSHQKRRSFPSVRMTKKIVSLTAVQPPPKLS